ncbi:MAG: hypothetical protein LBR73_04580 [Oscillospiraceae bacterium]|jgi:hypothetical protein|nr:hypothetical protein [Oscillospiraceae bacterium]
MDEFFAAYGRPCTLQAQGSQTQGEPFYAFIEPLRYKNKMYVGGINTQIGFNREGYYLCMAPAESGIAETPDGVIVLSPTESYTIDRAERVWLGTEICYIWAILRSVVV